MEIIKKDVKFNNDRVLAVMKDGKLYVGVSDICNNLKMSKKMKDRQVANIQSDVVLSKGCLKFGAGVFDQYNQTLAVELDYLPLWLAKIRITPNMVDEKKELVKKLEDLKMIQLKDSIKEISYSDGNKLVWRIVISSDNNYELNISKDLQNEIKSFYSINIPEKIYGELNEDYIEKVKNINKINYHKNNKEEILFLKEIIPFIQFK